VFVLLEASKVPAPLNGAALPKDKVGVFNPCVKLPVSTILLIVTVPELLLVSVVLPAGVTLPPKVIALAPSNDSFAEKAAAPVPLLKVVPLIVIPPPKLVAGFCPERFHTPPELIVTAPVNVFVPVAEVTVFTVPVIEEVPPMLKVKPPRLNVAPVPTVKPPVTVLFAPVVIAAVPLILRFPPMVVITGVAATEPLMLKSVPIVVTPVITAVPLPLSPNVL
jgi:hypothetical protein